MEVQTWTGHLRERQMRIKQKKEATGRDVHFVHAVISVAGLKKKKYCPEMQVPTCTIFRHSAKAAGSPE